MVWSGNRASVGPALASFGGTFELVGEWLRMDQDDVPDSASRFNGSGVHTLTLPVLSQPHVTINGSVEDFVALEAPLKPARTNGRGALGAPKNGSASRSHATQAPRAAARASAVLPVAA